MRRNRVALKMWDKKKLVSRERPFATGNDRCGADLSGWQGWWGLVWATPTLEFHKVSVWNIHNLDVVGAAHGATIYRPLGQAAKTEHLTTAEGLDWTIPYVQADCTLNPAAHQEEEILSVRVRLCRSPWLWWMPLAPYADLARFSHHSERRPSPLS